MWLTVTEYNLQLWQKCSINCDCTFDSTSSTVTDFARTVSGVTKSNRLSLSHPTHLEDLRHTIRFHISVLSYFFFYIISTCKWIFPFFSQNGIQFLWIISVHFEHQQSVPSQPSFYEARKFSLPNNHKCSSCHHKCSDYHLSPCDCETTESYHDTCDMKVNVESFTTSKSILGTTIFNISTSKILIVVSHLHSHNFIILWKSNISITISFFCDIQLCSYEPSTSSIKIIMTTCWSCHCIIPLTFLIIILRLSLI